MRMSVGNVVKFRGYRTNNERLIKSREKQKFTPISRSISQGVSGTTIITMMAVTVRASPISPKWPVMELFLVDETNVGVPSATILSS